MCKKELLKSAKETSPFKDEDYINRLKAMLNQKIEKISLIVEPFEICRNHTLILGSLEFMRIVLETENLEKASKKELLEFISYYITQIEDILEIADNDEKFTTMNLTILEKLFDSFQDYAKKHRIILRVDDEEFDSADFY